MEQRRVVCAAIRAEDGDILIGLRHYSADMHAQIERRIDGAKFHHRLDNNQGFVDQDGAYLTRSQAYNVAMVAGQIINQGACRSCELYSEGLY